MLKETLLTLWDLLRPSQAGREVAPARPRVNPRAVGGGQRGVERAAPTALVTAAPAKPAPPRAGRAKLDSKRKPAAGAPRARSKPAPSPDSAQARYDQVVAMMLKKYGVRVRKWRTSMSGVAWTVTYRDGTVNRLIESPKPKGPMSAAVFLHEIGHHAIGFNVYKPRCLEEYHAWAYAIQAMEELGLNVTESVHDRMYRSLHYAVMKAKRRGIKQIPPELESFEAKPPPRTKRRA